MKINYNDILNYYQNLIKEKYFEYKNNNFISCNNSEDLEYNFINHKDIVTILTASVKTENGRYFPITDSSISEEVAIRAINVYIEKLISWKLYDS